MSPVLTALLIEAAPVLVSAILLPVISYLVTKLPGPLRDALNSGTHKRDMDLLLGILERGIRAALASQMASSVASPSTGVPSAVAQGVIYAERNAPELLRKLGPSSDTLTTMGTAILDRVTTEYRLAERRSAGLTGLEGRGA